jgi:glycosyltransferase involved in cell wall biosynthesis
MTTFGRVIDLVLPCLDEAEGLTWVLSRLPAWAEPLVVDNGSTDGTADVARAAGIRLTTATIRGYGAACAAGLEAATSDVVVVMDCDGTIDPRSLDSLLAPVLSGDADLVVGRRRALSRKAWPWRLRLANRVLVRRLRRRAGVRLHDLGPVRVARREALLGLGVTDRRSGYPLETVLRAAEAGWRIREADVPYLPRVGRSKVTGTVRGTLQAVTDMSAVLRS